jgi:hypothetical protein
MNIMDTMSVIATKIPPVSPEIGITIKMTCDQAYQLYVLLASSLYGENAVGCLHRKMRDALGNLLKSGGEETSSWRNSVDGPLDSE